MEWVRTYGCLVSARRRVIYSKGKALSGGHGIEGAWTSAKVQKWYFYIFYSIWETSLIYGINRKLPWIPPPLRSISSNISKTKIIVFLWQVTHKANYCDKLFFYKCPALSLSLSLVWKRSWGFRQKCLPEKWEIQTDKKRLCIFIDKSRQLGFTSFQVI